MAKPWADFTVVCIASGPSLTSEDVERVHQWRIAADDRRVIVTNTTCRIAPWADVLYAMDAAWWRKMAGLARQFPGEKLTRGTNAPIAKRIVVTPSGNSGAGAITIAQDRGATRIILLGYDCQYAEDGKRHWHGDHPVGLGNCVSLPKFYDQFGEVARRTGRIEVLNATRRTVLDFWPLVDLKDTLKNKGHTC